MPFKDFATDDILTENDLDTYLMKQTIVVCTSGTRPPSPPQGMFIYETDTKALMLWNGTVWARAGAFDQSKYGATYSSDLTSISYSSTTYAAGSPVVGTTFVAPPSGAIFLSLSAYLASNNNTFEARLGFELRLGNVLGSGTVVTSPDYRRGISTSRAVTSGGEATLGASWRHVVTGLTPLADYNVRALHAVTGGTGVYSFRAVMTEPVM